MTRPTMMTTARLLAMKAFDVKPGQYGYLWTGQYHVLFIIYDGAQEWLEDTEPYHGAHPRTTEVDRPVDDVLGATLGGTEQNFNFRDTSVPKLPPEEQFRQEEEVQTPPRREPRRNEGHQPRGPRAMTDGTVLAPGGLADQRTDTAGRNRQNDEWSPVAALENTVSRMQ